MKFEQFGQNTPEKPRAIDEDIYEKYKAISIDTASLRRPEEEKLAEQKNLFMEGTISCPNFKYENINSVDFEKAEKDLIDLKTELKEGLTQNPDLNQAYIWKINEKIARVRMFKELKFLQENPSHDNKNRYRRYIEFIYGKPDKDIFFDVLNVIDKKFKDVELEALTEDQKDAYAVIQNLLENSISHDITDKKLDELRPNNPKERGESITDIEIIKKYFEEALDELNLQNEWRVVISEKHRSSMAVQTTSKKVILPSQSGVENRPKASEFSPEKIKGLIAHEIYTHVLRRERAKDSRFKLLELGLDRYEVGEEGLATYREQQESGAIDFAGIDNYLTAGIGYGLDSGKPRDFGEVFEIIKSYYLLFDQTTKEKAKELAWSRTLRLFRGTPGNIPGLMYLKDIVYREGNIATYELMKKDYSQKIDFDIGKFNPANTRHINLLVNLGILDSDLENLQK